MATQVYQGEEVQARKTSESETETLQKILDIKASLKEQYETLNTLLGSLPQNQALVASIVDPETKEPVDKTFIVGTPTGHYVNYKEVDLVMNAKTTKKLLKELGE